MKKFAVIGNPIEHSKSPDIHQLFAKQLNLELQYDKIQGEKEHFATIAKLFFTEGDGANVTLPFKEDALAFADKLSTTAVLSGAVNTLTQRNGMIYGDNTDGIGLVSDIVNNNQFDIASKKVLIIGAGGAARGVIPSLIEQVPTSITIANRTLSKAVALVDFFSDTAFIQARSIESLDCSYDLIINATSAGLTDQRLLLNPCIFDASGLAYDMVYKSTSTPFMNQAMSHNMSCVDGLGMLVEQAAQSFEIWHGSKPKTVPVIEIIRKYL